MRLPILSLIIVLWFISNASGQDGYVKGEPALAYWKLDGKEETIIMLHGGPSAPHPYLRPEFDALIKSGTIVYYDQRGCGKSQDGSKYTYQEHLQDLKRVVDTFSNNEKVVLVGSSWGSLLAILFAYYYPENVKGMILTGTVEWQGVEMDAENYALYRLKNLSIPPYPEIHKLKIKEEKLVLQKGTDGSVSKKIIPIEKEFEYFSGWYKREAFTSLVTAPNISKISQIKIPVLIFTGSRKKCGIEDWGHIYADKFQNSVLKTIEGACHDPSFSNPETFFKEANNFISGIKAKR